MKVLATVAALSVALIAPASSSPAAISASCRAAARAEFATVIRRVYDQAVDGREETSAVHRIESSTSLARAVATGRPAAVRAALAPLIKNQITRIDVSGHGRMLARVGSAPSYAPVHGTITLGGRVVGSYVLAVSTDATFTYLAHRLTGATVRLADTATTHDAFAATAFPSGRTVIAITQPAPSPSLCGATPAATQMKIVGLVGRNVIATELSGPDVTKTLRHVALDPMFARAVAAGDPAGVRAAVIAFFKDSRFHIVRVQASKDGHLINDVGGPFVLSPVSGVVRNAAGTPVGSFRLAVQDDTGYIKLVHEFTGAAVVLHASNGATVPGSTLMPGPPFAPGTGTTVYQGRRYRDYGFDAPAFPSGTLRVSLLV